jgi:lysophospholipase L1-like esterase
MRYFVVASWLLVLVACGGDDASPVDGGPTGDAAAVPPSDGAPTLDTGPGRDSGIGPSGDHASYVPPGLTPEAGTRLVVLGDSISAGSGASSDALVYHALLAQNADGPHPTESAADLETLTGGPVQIVDVSQGGATTGSLARQVDRVRSMISPPVNGHTVVVLTIGGNDLQGSIVGGNPTGAVLDAAIANLRAMVEFFQSPDNFRDGTSIYVADVYDPSDGVAHVPGCFFGLMLPALVAALDVWRDRYIELGTEMGFAVIDTLGHFHGHGHHHDDATNPFYDAADPSGWFADCIHPNDRGHHEIRRLFYEAMDPSYVVD